LSAGTLELTAVDAAADENALVFDPARVTDGIELSDDPVLRFRPAAYSESVTRRTAA
jgi:catalase